MSVPCTALSSKVNLPYVIDFGSLCGAHLVTVPHGIEGGRSLRAPPRGCPPALFETTPTGVPRPSEIAQPPGTTIEPKLKSYWGTLLITCGDFENACLFLKKIRIFSKNGCLFLKTTRNFSKNGCLFLIFFRPLPLCDVVSDQKKKS